ncbi:hypothetical protein CHUAL_012494 [Chamberlinius hualienensis]
MAVHTTMLDFHVDSSLMSSQNDTDNLKQSLISALEERSLRVCYKSECESGFRVICEGPQDVLLTLRCYPTCFLTVTIEEYVHSSKTLNFSSEDKLEELNHIISRITRCTNEKRYPAIKRGAAIDQYVYTSDERLLEYDFDEVLYEAQSPYQKITILHSVSFGNFLMLDDLQNLAESDLVYTQTLMRYGEIDYTNKTVLILGGGDGGLLHELLKENPAFVTMVDIDQMVMEACRQHLRSVCGSCLDNFEGPTHKIIVDDCVKVMKKFIKEGKKFDFVFGDLTDIPITPTPQGKFWDFIRLILDLSFQLLAPNGRFLTHGNGIGSKRALEMYEEQLQNLHCSVQFTRFNAYVPSFMENWIFYEVRRKECNGEAYTNGSHTVATNCN